MSFGRISGPYWGWTYDSAYHSLSQAVCPSKGLSSSGFTRDCHSLRYSEDSRFQQRSFWMYDGAGSALLGLEALC